MATVRGTAVVWGSNNVTMTGAVISATHSSLRQSIDVTRDSSKVDVQDYQGDTKACVFHDFKKRVTINVIPTGTTLAAAASSLDAYMPKAGEAITLVPSGVTLTGTFLNGINSGAYNVLSSRIAQTNTSVSIVTIECEQYEANDVTLAVT